MKKILEIELTGLQKTILLLIASASLVLKVLFDSFFLLLEQYDSFLALSLRLVFSLLTVFSFILLFFVGFKLKFGLNDTGFDSYLSDTIKIISISFILNILSFFLPNSVIAGGNPNSLFEIIFINFYSLTSLILSLIIFKFFFKWIWHRRFKWTKKQLKMILILTLLIIIIIDIPNHFSHIDAEELKDNTFLLTISFLINLTLIFIIFTASTKNQWIANLNISDKWKVFALSLLNIVFSLLFIIADFEFDGDGEFSNSLSSIFPVASIFGVSTVILLVYSIRVFFSAIFSMPTSSIIERKSNELNSLTYLSRIVSQAIDFDSLIDTISNLSLISGGGSVVWTDISDDNQKYKVRSVKFSDDTDKSLEILGTELDEKFYIDEGMEFLRELTGPFYIESIPDYENDAVKSLVKILNAKSLIIMPMFSGLERIGTLYLVHQNEYGFDSEFLTLLTAFNDNLNIAIENIRLLEESIEKEKYKRELNIARDMEQKLIPDTMPEEENYSIAGYTISATEVGGDYYDIVKLKDGKTCILAADVSGKGMSAAFYMVLLKGVVLAAARQVETVSELLKRINEIIYLELEKKMFITMSAIKILDCKGNLSLARAGHMPFLLKTDEQVLELKPKGLGLGLVPAEKFDKNLEEISLKLEDNNSLLMYSDGVVEIFKEGKEIQTDFLKQLIKNSVYNNSREMLKDIKRNIDNMKNEYTIIDDMTLVCLSYYEMNDDSNKEIKNA